MRVDIARAEAVREIEALLAAFPELAEDADLRADCIEGETGAHDVLALLSQAMLADEAMADGIAEAVRSLSSRKARIEARSERCRAAIVAIMQAGGLRKVATPAATLSITEGKPRPIVTDEGALPECFITTIRKPNMAAIRAAIDGAPIPGVAMTNGGEPSLRVSRK